MAAEKFEYSFIYINLWCRAIKLANTEYVHSSISNWQPKFKCQSYKEYTEFIILCYVNKARTVFLFTLVQCIFKRSFSSWFFYLIIHVKQFLTLLTFILGLNLEFYLKHLKYKQKHDLSFKLKFWLINRIVFQKHCKKWKRKNKFWPYSWPWPLKVWYSYPLTSPYYGSRKI